MYICVLDEFPDYMTPTLVGHAVLRHHLAFIDAFDNYIYRRWLSDSFKKVVVKVNQKEFDKIKKFSGALQSWENNTLGGKPACLTIVVDDVIPDVLKFAKLWKPNV
jgi:hypothetical protein